MPKFDELVISNILPGITEYRFVVAHDNAIGLCVTRAFTSHVSVFVALARHAAVLYVNRVCHQIL